MIHSVLRVKGRGSELGLRTLGPYLFGPRLIDDSDDMPRFSQPECNGQARDTYKIVLDEYRAGSGNRSPPPTTMMFRLREAFTENGIVLSETWMRDRVSTS